MQVGICVLFVAAVCLLSAVDSLDNYDVINFPGPTQKPPDVRYGTPDEDVPMACRNLTFCTVKPKSYPQERFNKIFRGTKPQQQPTLIIETVADRQGDPDDMDDCTSEVSYKPLYKVRNKRGDWRTVVQAPQENYVQMVRLETCTGEGAPCFNALSMPQDIKTFCKQKYSTWEFLVDSGVDNQPPVKEKVDLPICCSCNYKYIT